MGLKYGLLFGLGTGISMGYDTYSVMPIPHHLALVYLVGVLIKTVAGAILAALILKSLKES